MPSQRYWEEYWGGPKWPSKENTKRKKAAVQTLNLNKNKKKGGGGKKSCVSLTQTNVETPKKIKKGDV